MTEPSSPVDETAAAKQRLRATWELGDYSRTSGILEPASVELAEACGIEAGQEVLDVAAGDGNFAAACARRGAKVTASDFAPGMVERGRTRTMRDGLDVTWLEADAEALPFGDRRFDRVGSVFGAVNTPQADLAATELLRVTRPGGIVGLTAWPTGGLMLGLVLLSLRFVPGAPPPSDDWTDEEKIRDRLGPRVERVAIQRRTLTVEDRSPTALLERLATGSGPMRALRDSLPPDRLRDLDAAQLDYVIEHNEATDGRVLLRPEYLQVTAGTRS